MNRKELKDHLYDIQGGLGMEGFEIGIETIDEVLDILEDYDCQAEQIRLLTKKYETPRHAFRNSHGFYVCPACNRRIALRNNYCWHCGQMLKERKARIGKEDNRHHCQ